MMVARNLLIDIVLRIMPAASMQQALYVKR